MRRSSLFAVSASALGRPRQLDRFAVARGEPPLVGDREVLDRSFGRAAGRGERVGGRAARGDRRLAVALQLVHGREASLGLGHGALVAGRGDQFPPRAGGFGELAGELAAARVALQQFGPAIVVAAVGPQLERLAGRLGRIPVGVQRVGLGRRVQERLARLLARPRAEPVPGDLAALAARRARAPRRACGAARGAASRGRRRRTPRASARAGTSPPPARSRARAAPTARRRSTGRPRAPDRTSRPPRRRPRPPRALPGRAPTR